MQMKGEQLVAAPRQQVWEALNDPAVLAQCIPGCQSLERDGADGFLAIAEVKIGPIGARFKGDVRLSDLDAPNGYTITGSGNGGIAGSAKGGARVRLSEAASGATLVSYDVDAEVGGRMAQLGGPIIDATAKNLANKFFTKFGEVVASGETPPGAVTGSPSQVVGETGATHVAEAPMRHAASAQPAPLWGWVAALVVAVLAGFGLGRIGSMPHLLILLILLVLTAAAAYDAGRRRGGA